MPSMADITVLNAASANVVYTAVSPSAGDNVPAIWRANALSTHMGYRPEFRFLMRDNGKRNGRIFRSWYKFPITGTDSTTGQPFLIATTPFETNGTIPTNVDASVAYDAYVQYGNLLVSALMRASASSGSAPT